MADELKVDLGALRGLAADIESINGDLTNTASLIDSHRDDLGSSTVQDALSGFEDHWSKGRRKIGEKAESLSSMLSESADTYETTDQDNADAVTTEQASTQVGSGGGTYY